MLAPDSAAQARAVAAGAALLHWVATTGSDEQAIFLRNTSAHVIEVTGYEIYECFNLRRQTCGKHSSTLRIAAGETGRLQRITPRSPQDAWSYRYRFTATFEPAAGDSAGGAPQ